LSTDGIGAFGEIGAAPNCMISRSIVNHAIMKKILPELPDASCQDKRKKQTFTVTASSTDLMSWGADMVNAKIMKQQ